MYKVSKQHLIEMANLHPSGTGLPMIVWTVPKGVEPHGPRLKVQRNYSSNEQLNDSFSVSISSTPKIKAGDKGIIKQKDVEKVYIFITQNLKTLLDYYNREIDTIAFAHRLIPYKK